MIAVFEAPDDAAYAKVMLLLGSKGGCAQRRSEPSRKTNFATSSQPSPDNRVSQSGTFYYYPYMHMGRTVYIHVDVDAKGKPLPPPPASKVIVEVDVEVN